MDIVALDDHIAQIDADAKLESPVGRQPGIALCLGTLNIDGAAHSIDDAVELDQQAVTMVLTSRP
jgi:hypothetical protein